MRRTLHRPLRVARELVEYVVTLVLGLVLTLRRADIAGARRSGLSIGRTLW